MNSSTKLATIFAVVATLSGPAAFSQGSTQLNDNWFSVDGNASGSLVYSTTGYKMTVDDIRDFNDLGKKVKVKDLQGDIVVKAATAIGIDAAAKLGLEENSDDLSIDMDDLKSKVRELYVGIDHHGAMVLFGRMDIKFAGDVSRRAVDRNNPTHRVLEQNERTVQAVIALDERSPLLSAVNRVDWAQVNAIEISKFASSSQRNDLKFNNTLDSEAIRIVGTLGKVLAQASYMRVQGIERQASISAEADLSTTITGPFTVYGEVLAIRDSLLNGNSNYYTLGAEKRIDYLSNLLKRDTSAFVEGARVYNKDSKSSSNQGATGLKVQATDRIQFAAEYSTHAPGAKADGAPTIKDPTVNLQMKVVARKGKSERTSMFPRTKAAKSAQDAAMKKKIESTLNK